MKQTLGLSTYQWNNNIKSMLILAAFPCLLLGMVALFFFVVGWMSADPNGLVHMFGSIHNAGGLSKLPSISEFTIANSQMAAPYALGIAAGWIAIGSLLNEQLIRMATGAKPIHRKQHKELYNLLENLCISRGMAMPKFYIIDTPALNAYASGLSEDSFAVTVTQGLLDRLNKEEIRAVLAHELSHIINRDVRLLIITVLFGGMIAFFAEFAWRSMRYSGRGRGRGKGNLIIIAAIILSVGYLVSMFFRFALSRRREFLADAGAVELTKDPSAMISALQKISGHAAMPNIPKDVQAMLIENPPQFFGLMATHPPIKDRIEVLRQFGGIVDEGSSIIPKIS